jgi:hypothetical protein
MTSWSLKLPMRDPDEPLDVDAITDLPAALETRSEQQIARELLLAARLDGGFQTVGEVHARIEAMSGAERRQLLDRFRRRVGLDSTEKIDARRQVEMASSSARLTAAKESPWQVCHGEGCGQIPINELGLPTTTEARRWFCRDHRDQAQPGDMQPRPLRIRRAPSGALVEYDPDELAREATAEASRAALRETQQAERQVEAQERRDAERAARERVEREVPDGVPR